MTARAFAIALMLFLGFALPCVGQTAEEEEWQGEEIYQGAYTSAKDGSVYIQHRDETDWSELVLNMPVFEGDRVSSGEDGRAELTFTRNDKFRIWAGTTAEIRALNKSAAGLNLLVSVQAGTAHFSCAPGSWSAQLEIGTPWASIRSSSGGSARLDVEAAGTVWLTVREGEYEVIGQMRSVTVSAGMRIRVQPGEPAEDPWYVPTDEELDNFDLWINELDAPPPPPAAPSGGYEEAPPADTPDGAYEELAVYGSWMYVPDYGRCWRPTRISFGWAPYYHGYWQYNGRWGWMWISYDPWGWYPYHYGRWAFDPGYGWFWVPGRFWGPAWVWWFHTDGHIGWTPRHPRDRYHRHWDRDHRHGYDRDRDRGRGWDDWNGKPPINAMLDQENGFFVLPIDRLQRGEAAPIERRKFDDAAANEFKFADKPVDLKPWQDLRQFENSKKARLPINLGGAGQKPGIGRGTEQKQGIGHENDNRIAPVPPPSRGHGGDRGKPGTERISPPSQPRQPEPPKERIIPPSQQEQPNIIPPAQKEPPQQRIIPPVQKEPPQQRIIPPAKKEPPAVQQPVSPPTGNQRPPVQDKPRIGQQDQQRKPGERPANNVTKPKKPDEKPPVKNEKPAKADKPKKNADKVQDKEDDKEEEKPQLKAK